MNKIDYLIAAFFIIVIVAALYIRFTYEPPININVNIGSYNGTAYPFEKISIPIEVNNIGSSNIKDMGFEVLVNGNTTMEYSLTIPSGKEAVFYFNYTPTSSGNYNITAIADPAKLYPIVDRQRAMASTKIVVAVPQALEPYAQINPNNIVYIKEANLTNTGALLSIYLSKNYTINLFNFTDLNIPYNLFSSLIGLTYNYINQIGMAYANYTNGSSIYAIWIKGYINEAAVQSAISAIDPNYSIINMDNTSLTFAKLKNTTICSWYSNGWIKNIVYKGGNCESLILSNYSNPIPNNQAFESISNFSPDNATLLGTYEGYYFSSNAPFAAKILAYPNAVIFPSVSENLGSIVCYGVMSNLNNQSYCSTYLFPASHKIGKLGLIMTTTYIPPYNYTLFSLINQSGIVGAVPVNVNLLQKLGGKGKSLQFISGFSNACNIPGFYCSNVNFANGMIYLTLKNTGNSTISINSFECFVQRGFFKKENVTLAPGSEANLNTTCYQNDSIITGIPLGLKVNLALNYTQENVSKTVIGSAIVNFFS